MFWIHFAFPLLAQSHLDAYKQCDMNDDDDDVIVVDLHHDKSCVS